MSFLLTSPLINEVAVLLLLSLVGWEVTIIYVVVGMSIGIAGGVVFDLIGAEKLLQRIWMWVFIGVGLGAALHGFVPDSWFAENLGSGQWWSVRAAVLAGIPLYSNATGVIPIMESLIVKGLPLGTTLASC